jgi:hypothetical protein
VAAVDAADAVAAAQRVRVKPQPRAVAPAARALADRARRDSAAVAARA